MYFKYFSFILLLLVSAASNADNSDLTLSAHGLEIKPNKCVALNEGRACYTEVSISWHTETADEYCLIQINSLAEEKQFGCWFARKNGTITIDLALEHSVDFQLVRKNNQEVLASTTFQVSWLYESRPRKRRWRLF
ncbi:DUF3019 domain-containing protein [Agaribacter flavus]|uniref:DUF3019 domain-containing protein n=1 Tax=Agaribacter flavus TaxID=1902781 RepID=A0ABV7FKQ1_9ALTE